MSKKKILIVDDDTDMIEQTKAYLESIGYSVFEAYSQKEAEELIEQGEFDAAVVDLMLENPDSGFVLSSKIKKKFPQKPVIMITSVGKETGIFFDKRNDTGNWIKADVVIQKDLRFEQLEKELEKLLEKK
ncbi:MAG: response regulator [Acidobacteriota bacterium]|nr:response regulator [Thermoanaerobaculaceae bacterium]